MTPAMKAKLRNSAQCKGYYARNAELLRERARVHKIRVTIERAIEAARAELREMF